MKIAAQLILQWLAWLLIAPLLPGIVNKVKALVAGRRGPPVLQLYFDLARLWRKETVVSTLASPGFVIGPAVGWVMIVGAVTLMPLGPLPSPLGFEGDVILLVYLLAAARFCTAWAAMETGSAFEGMGAAREVSFAVFGEAALITAVIALSLNASEFSLNAMLTQSTNTAGAALLAAGLFIVLLAENSRVPFDDPNTHLELTMVHEVMVLDHSGPPLAIILHGAALKLLFFAVLVSQTIAPLLVLDAVASAIVLGVLVLAVTIAVGFVESLLARYAFRRVPLMLVTAFLFCLFALLLNWKGAGA